jgi:hypothetical protein
MRGAQCRAELDDGKRDPQVAGRVGGVGRDPLRVGSESVERQSGRGGRRVARLL